MGEKIKSARIEKRLTLEKLSEKIGISRNFLWEIEAGRKAPAIQTLYRIGKELSLSVDYILGLSNNVKWIDDKEEKNINFLIKKLDKKEMSIVCRLLETYLESK
ncbi:MAG: helix-turn-helix transcriptional regulator [Clostridia bacterium]|nr:helix-turn-helix transcriptional regulator [Clostridia bacterium]